MKVISACIMIILLSSCCANEVSQPLKRRISGTITADNYSEKFLRRVVAQFGEIKHEFGVLGVGSGATMGFAQLELGKELSISWGEGEDNLTPKIKVVRFDSNKLENVASQVGYFRFVYLGNDKWKLRVHKTDHGTEAENGFLAEVDSMPVADYGGIIDNERLY